MRKAKMTCKPFCKIRLAVLLILALGGWLYCLPRPLTTTAQSSQEAANPWRPANVPKANADGFILIQGGAFWSGDVVTRKERAELVRVEDFEMLDHPVTNAEYQSFVDAAGFAAPQLGQKGACLPG
jgi:formylglycine-generating enzyme required for sulfatase activity